MWEKTAGDWKAWKGRLRERWGEITDDEWNVIAGRREQLVAQLQQRYGMPEEEAEREIAAMEGEKV